MNPWLIVDFVFVPHLGLEDLQPAGFDLPQNFRIAIRTNERPTDQVAARLFAPSEWCFSVSQYEFANHTL